MARSSTTFKKGEAKGRPQGTPNKTTRDIKEAYRMLIENNLDNLTLWLEKIANKDPEKAIRIMSDLSEYVIPKLARAELTGKDGKDLMPKITIEVIDSREQVKKEDDSSRQ